MSPAPHSQEANFPVLIKRCCAGGNDREFENFRSAWHPYLEAALALVGTGWTATERLYEPIYQEYRSIFQEYNPHLDYEIYLLAIGYSHLVQQRGDHMLRQLLTVIFGGSSENELSRHEVNTLVFCAILSMRDGCVSLLLNACFHPRRHRWAGLQFLLGQQPDILGLPSHCIKNLNQLLAPVLC
jgi:hypothetical protein